MIALRHRLKRNLSWGLLALWAVLIPASDITYGFHWPWDQGHDTSNPNLPPDDQPPGPPCDCNNATGSPVFLASGRYFRTVVDLSIPAQGIPLEVSRTYQTKDRYSGLFGLGWVFTLDTRLIIVSDGPSRYAIVRMPDGRRVRYQQTGSSTFASPPGVFNTLAKRLDGGYDLVEKDGFKRTFNADGNMTAVIDRYGNRVSLTYTPDGLIRSVANGGRSIQFTLGVNGKIASITDHTNRTVAYTYDAAGRLTAVTDAAGNLTNYEYDARNYLTRITARMSTSRTDVLAQIFYDNAGRAVRVVDHEGDFRYVYNAGETRKIDNAPNAPQPNATWIYRYDSRGIITEIVDPPGGRERRTYDANGLLTQVINKNGHVTSLAYDGAGNLVRKTQAEGQPEQRVLSFAYDPVFSKVLTQTDPRGVITKFEYDALGNLLRRIEAFGRPEQRTTTHEYDAAGNLTRTVYADGAAERFTYDVAGNQLTRTDALNNVTRFTYDALGRMLCRTDANNHALCFDYDVLNRVRSVTDAAGNRVDFTYDAAGNILTYTNPVGEVTGFTYDAFRRPLTITDHYGNVTTRAYDAHGNRISELSANGKIVYYKYDAQDRLVRVVQKVGETTDRITAADAVADYTYDALGNRTSVRDPNGNLQRIDYDPLQRVKALTRPNGLVLNYAYDANDNLTRIQRSDGYVATLQYNSFNARAQEADAIGLLANYTYDARDRRLSVADGNGGVTRYAYDAAGRQTSITDPAGQVTRFEYDAVGNLLRQTDREGRLHTFAYDALDRPVSTTDPLNNTTTFAYDAAGRLVEARDGNGNRTATAYSGSGTRRLIRQTYADGTVMQLEFDGVGNLVRRTDPNGAVTSYGYDDLNRLVQRDYPGANDDAYTYDKGGRMLTATNANATLAFAYDTVGRVTSLTQNGVATTYAYTPADTERTITYPGGRRVRETYDGRLRLTRVDNLLPTTNQLAQIDYDLGNRVTAERLLNGVRTDFTYNANSQITQSLAQLGAALRVGFEYRFDREDQRLSAKRLHDLGRSERYFYDAGYRLEQSRRGALDPAGEIPAPINQSLWTLDRAGNWSRWVRDGVTETRAHNLRNQTTAVDARTLRYDANGNLTDDGINTYAYDFENRLTQVARRSDGQVLARFRYDALERRVEKEVGGVITAYYYDGPNVIEERQGGAPVATYVFGRDLAHVLAMERGGQHFYYHTNALRTVEALTNAAGAVVERYLYDAYGRPRIFDGAGMELPGSAVGNPYLFTTQRWDAEAGMYDYKARHYHPDLGRFVQPDPLIYLSVVDALDLTWPVPDGDRRRVRRTGRWLLEDPITPERGVDAYAYVGNNPVNRLDPFGLDWLDNLSNFAAGFGDTLTFGATAWVRRQMGVDDVVDYCSGWYVAGEATEIVGEIAITGGGAALRHAAGRVASRQALGAAARREARQIVGAVGRDPVHHINTLFGHPPIPGVRGARPSYFPTGGLPPSVYNHPWNLTQVTAAEHARLHARAYRAEQLLYYGTHPAATAARAGSAAYRHSGRDCNGGCK